MKGMSEGSTRLSVSIEGNVDLQLLKGYFRDRMCSGHSRRTI